MFKSVNFCSVGWGGWSCSLATRWLALGAVPGSTSQASSLPVSSPPWTGWRPVPKIWLHIWMWLEKESKLSLPSTSALDSLSEFVSKTWPVKCWRGHLPGWCRLSNRNSIFPQRHHKAEHRLPQGKVSKSKYFSFVKPNDENYSRYARFLAAILTLRKNNAD